MRDTALVLGSMFDGIEFRGFKQEHVEDLAKYSGVPVWNGLTDKEHPTQMLADFMTMKENFGTLEGLTVLAARDGAFTAAELNAVMTNLAEDVRLLKGVVFTMARRARFDAPG